MTKSLRPSLHASRFLACGFLLTSALALPALAETKPAAPAASKSPDAMMKAWMAYATPGAEQKALEAYAGSWNVKVKAWMMPGAPPSETTGTTENKMILGGRFLEQTYEGTMMGGPFSGRGMTGFDNYSKKYVSTWVDTMATGVMEMTGTMDKSGKVLTTWGTMNDPAAHKAMKTKAVWTVVDADNHTYESWHAGDGGKMMKDLEIAYTRKK